MKEYKTIVIDPPWPTKGGGLKRTPGNKLGRWCSKPEYLLNKPLAYPTLSIEQLSLMQLPAAKDAHLYLWTPNSQIESAYYLCRKWGFRPSILMVWCKTPMGVGFGGSYIPTTEYILYGRKGRLKGLSRINTTWWRWKRGKHSEKPEEFQDMVMKVSPPPYLEMFARRKREDWDVWGNEVESGIDLTVPEMEQQSPVKTKHNRVFLDPEKQRIALKAYNAGLDLIRAKTSGKE